MDRPGQIGHTQRIGPIQRRLVSCPIFFFGQTKIYRLFSFAIFCQYFLRFQDSDMNFTIFLEPAGLRYFCGLLALENIICCGPKRQFVLPATRFLLNISGLSPLFCKTKTVTRTLYKRVRITNQPRIFPQILPIFRRKNCELWLKILA